MHVGGKRTREKFGPITSVHLFHVGLRVLVVLLVCGAPLGALCTVAFCTGIPLVRPEDRTDSDPRGSNEFKERFSLPSNGLPRNERSSIKQAVMYFPLSSLNVDRSAVRPQQGKKLFSGHTPN